MMRMMRKMRKMRKMKWSEGLRKGVAECEAQRQGG